MNQGVEISCTFGARNKVVKKIIENFRTMKNIIFVFPILLVLAIVIGIDFGSQNNEYQFTASKYSTVGKDLHYYVPNEAEITTPTTSLTPHNYIFLGKSYIGFKEALGFKESRGRYHSVNPYGYLGKYQFSKSTLKMMGFRNIDNFLKNTKQQEAAFNAYVSFNKWVLRNDIDRFVGETIGGVEVTESGLLAAAHLAGPGNVRKYLRSNGRRDVSDANGASVRYYLKKFSGYDTSAIPASKKPQRF